MPNTQTTWRFLAVDLITGVVREELSPLSATWTHELNRAGSMTLNFGLYDCGLTEADIWRTVVYVERNGIVVGDGIVVGGQGDTGSVRIGAKSMHHYLHKRVITPTATYINVPQTQIVKQLIDTYAAPSGINVDVQVLTENKNRDRTYYGYEFQTVGSVLEDLTDVIGGPDIEFIVGSQDEGYPRKAIVGDSLGRDTDIVLASEVTLSNYGQDIDGLDMANHVNSVGAGEEETMLVQSASRPLNGRPQLDKTTNYKTVVNATTLQEHAAADVDLYEEPYNVPTLALTNPQDPVPGQWRAGDWVQVKLNDGWLNYNGRARIIGWRHAYDSTGNESIQFDVTNE